VVLLASVTHRDVTLEVLLVFQRRVALLADGGPFGGGDAVCARRVALQRALVAESCLALRAHNVLLYLAGHRCRHKRRVLANAQRSGEQKARAASSKPLLLVFLPLPLLRRPVRLGSRSAVGAVWQQAKLLLLMVVCLVRRTGVWLVNRRRAGSSDTRHKAPRGMRRGRSSGVRRSGDGGGKRDPFMLLLARATAAINSAGGAAGEADLQAKDGDLSGRGDRDAGNGGSSGNGSGGSGGGGGGRRLAAGLLAVVVEESVPMGREGMVL
jgi:hypothetical protein